MQTFRQEQEMSKQGTLAVAALATAILMLDIAVVNTALGHIADDLGTGLSGIQWVVDAYTLALASVVLTAGSVADRLGRKRVFTFGVVLFTVASAACAAAGSIVALDVARAVQGIGGRSCSPPRLRCSPTHSPALTSARRRSRSTAPRSAHRS